jgi:hypothetical protein
VTTFTLRVPAATPLSQVIEMGTAAVIEREQRPMRAVLIDTAATVDRDTYLATFQAAPLWPLSRQEN